VTGRPVSEGSRDTMPEDRLPLTPVVFLDLDDVLCIHEPYGGFDAIEAVHGRHVNPAAVYGGLFATRARHALNRVHDAMGARVRYVISSTWRDVFSREQLESVFRQGGLEFVADCLVEGELWRTPSKLRLGQRVDEIAQWLHQHHQGEPFVVIDDTHSGASLLRALKTSPGGDPHSFKGRVVLCQENVGLTDAHVPTIVEALRRELVRPAEVDDTRVDAKDQR
jgi:hypothetical protein